MGREDDEIDGTADGNDGQDEEIDPDDVPTIVVAASGDPMERARAALRSARLARGMDPDAPDPAGDTPLPTDPTARAEAVLERAASAREEASKGKLVLEREARAKEELARLKATGGGRASASSTPADDVPADGSEDAAPKPTKPKQRRL